MSSVIREIDLGHGHMLRFHDETRRYYGSYFLVKVDVVCHFPLQPNHFSSVEIYDDAVQLMGNAVTYRRPLEQMGIHADDVERVKNSLIENFISNSLPYITDSCFAARFVLSEYEKRKNKVRRLYPK